MTPKIPDSFKRLPHSTLLSLRDMAEIYGVTIDTASKYSRTGRFPAPCETQRGLNQGAERKYHGRKPKLYNKNQNMRFWSLGDVRRHVAQINAEKGAA